VYGTLLFIKKDLGGFQGLQKREEETEWGIKYYNL